MTVLVTNALQEPMGPAVAEGEPSRHCWLTAARREPGSSHFSVPFDAETALSSLSLGSISAVLGVSVGAGARCRHPVSVCLSARCQPPPPVLPSLLGLEGILKEMYNYLL